MTRPGKSADWFSRFATRVAHTVGRPVVFALACIAVVAWAAIGPFVGFSDVWQLTINTGTTIVTFLVVFLIQNTQNRDSAAVQIKLDELLRATAEAHNSLLNLEELSEQDIETFRQRYIRLASMARKKGIPEIEVDAEERATDEAAPARR
ncbi:low affinity iron permease family protein [Vineibacter terrae]|uniref:Low affinity iron permease family protein n=1 Tax=Vineibacter terrae TaxID=2586908 RepID=A0A5C8PD41_9HYPH|nr:low affinity iron permease family protein [Vineibacter terrae]TXL71718.1 low affinity iron permease family protein [Vineibacter terrae]